VSDPVKAVITEFMRLLEFQKKCLAQVTDTARSAKPIFRRHELVRLATDVKDSFKHTLNNASVVMVIRDNLSPQGRIVECDEFLIRQVLINLIDNSLHWISQVRKKVIEIRLHNIKDTGPGIAQEIRDRIWEPFFTMKAGGGLGLGLTITKRIVEKAHNGTIQLYSDAGWGTYFQIRLPLKQQ